MRSAPPVFSTAEAERIARDEYGLAVSVRPLSGERDCNFRARTTGRDYVLKILGAAPAAAQCQVDVLRHLAEQDPTLSVPAVLSTQQGADLGQVVQGDLRYATLLTTYLPGEMLWDATPDHSLLRSVGGSLARIDRALQGFTHPSLAEPIAWDVRSLPQLLDFAAFIDVPDLRSRVESAAAAVREALPALRGLRSQAIHGDGHGGNVLVGKTHDVSGVLDFGDILHAPLILEPAVAMAELLTTPATAVDHMTAILEGYLQVQSLKARDIALLYDVVAGRNAVTLLIRAWRGRHDPPGARLLDRHAEHAALSLDVLATRGRESLTALWHRVAGTTAAAPVTSVDLGRRRRLMGRGAELFYEQPLHLVRGEGVWLYDGQGRAYLDVYNNVPHVGHCHPTVVGAVQRQAARLATHTRYLHESILEYAEQLTARCPAHLDTCLFVNSGSEANDAAWRMAQLATGHDGALVVTNAYHGVTAATAALTPSHAPAADPRVGQLAAPGADPRAAAEDVQRAIDALRGRGRAPAAFFLDTALTSSGIYDPPPAWADAVTSRVRAAGALVVADEVQYGLGRSGSHFFGFERRGLVPDIVTLGKPVGNGYPMGVVIAPREMVEAFQARFGFFSTFGGNPVAAAAGLAVLQVLERERLIENAGSTGDYLAYGLAQVAARHECLGAVRGTGLLLGLEVLGAGSAAGTAHPGDPEGAPARTRQIVNALAARARVLIGSEGPLGTLLKLRPPMPFRREHADLLVQAIDAAARSVEASPQSAVE